MKRAIASLVILAALAGRASAASCNPWQGPGHSIWDCGKLEGTAWLVTAPVWVPVTLVYFFLGGELPYQQQAREEKQRQGVAAWQRMSPSERQEAIQLMQLQQQQQQLEQQKTDAEIRALQQLQQMNQPPQAPRRTTCNPNGVGGVDCTEW